MNRRYVGSKKDIYYAASCSVNLINYVYQSVGDGFDGIILDVGTGSGVFAISLSYLLPQSHIIATDISFQAISTAQRNVLLHKKSSIHLLQTNYVDDCERKPDIIVATLPYGNEKYLTPGNTMKKLKQFPPISCFHSTRDPFGCYTELLQSITKKGRTNLVVYIEVGIMPKSLIEKYLYGYNYRYITLDQNGFSIVVITIT